MTVESTNLPMNCVENGLQTQTFKTVHEGVKRDVVRVLKSSFFYLTKKTFRFFFQKKTIGLMADR